ncbi:MAG: M48 family metallopeptidase [Saprospiraceae bacterium]|nr:M48 family metallopeptidase [Saprospiraceae bacterium]
MKITKTIQVGPLEVPFIVIRERRRSCRVSLIKEGVCLRRPKRWHGPGEDPEIWAHRWLQKQYEKRPTLFQRYQARTIHDQKEVVTAYGTFPILLHVWTERKTTVQVVEDSLVVKHPADQIVMTDALRKEIGTCLSRHLFEAFRADLRRLNETHFGFDHGRIRFKYNHSNWGSCSSKGNLNFSTRVLLTPRAVLEYVIVHELAHLKVLDHSKRFWALVASAFPDYQHHRSWLKTHGAGLDF